MKITTEPRKLALAMLNEMHATMGTELVYKTKFEKLAIDKIAEKHFAAALKAQAKQIEALQAEADWRDVAAGPSIFWETADLLEAQAKQIASLESELTAATENWGHMQSAYASEKADSLEKSKQIEALQSQLDDYTLMMTAKVEALQAEAERYRVGREAAFAGLLVDFPHTKTWSDAMDFAYDQMIAARKGNV